MWRHDFWSWSYLSNQAGFPSWPKIWLFICDKTKFFFWENICFLQNDTTFAEKIVFIWKKNFILKFFFYWKKRFLHFSNENIKINISFGKYIFIQKMFVLQIKYKSFLNIYSFCKKKKNLIIKNIFVKTSLWTE